MATPNKDDPKKNVEPNRAGTDINKNVEKVTPSIKDTVQDTEKDVLKDEEKEEQERAKEEEKLYNSRMKYATDISNADEAKYIESEDDWGSVNRLIAEGHAVLNAEQKGMEVKNYITLTEDGVRAVQAYNTQED